MSVLRSGRIAAAVVLGLAVVAFPAPAAAERTEPPRAERVEAGPRGLDGVGLTDRLDNQVPLDLAFTDENGRSVTLRDLVRPARPTILTLNYYRCPMLCTLVLNGLVGSLKTLDLAPGRDFQVVTVSIDPLETPALAREKKQNYIEDLAKPGAEDGWRFLTGRQESIKPLADAVGFGYRYVEEDRQYAHPAAIFVLTPDGKVSRTLAGVEFDPKTLRLSLVEASHGGIGTPLDQFVLFCFHYDASAGRYAPVAMRLMQVGGALTAAILAAALSLLWVRERRRRPIS